MQLGDVECTKLKVKCTHNRCSKWKKGIVDLLKLSEMKQDIRYAVLLIFSLLTIFPKVLGKVNSRI